MKPAPTPAMRYLSGRMLWHSGPRMRRRSAAWLGAALILFAALFPLVSQAGSRAFGSVEWVELCTAFGMERIALDRDGNPVDADDETIARCLVCKLCTSSFLLTSAESLVPAPDAVSDHALSRGYVQPDPEDCVQLQARPRAPPAFTG